MTDIATMMLSRTTVNESPLYNVCEVYVCVYRYLASVAAVCC